MYNNTKQLKYGVGKKKAWNDPKVLQHYVTEGKEPGNTHTREFRKEAKGRFTADTTVLVVETRPEPQFDMTKVPVVSKGKGHMKVDGVPTAGRSVQHTNRTW